MITGRIRLCWRATGAACVAKGAEGSGCAVRDPAAAHPLRRTETPASWPHAQNSLSAELLRAEARSEGLDLPGWMSGSRA
jgi:hypothetical protein